MIKSKKILIAIDEPEMAEVIVKTACNFIDEKNTEITLLNVLEITSAEEEFFLREPEKFIAHESLKSNFSNLETYLKKNSNYKGMMILEGIASKQIINLCKKEKYDLIVIGCNEKNTWEKILLGSTSYKVVRDSKCSVLVIKPDKKNISDKKKNYKTLFATDGSNYSEYIGCYIDKILDKAKTKISILNARIPFNLILPQQDSYSYVDLSPILEEAENFSKNIINNTSMILEKNGFKVDEKISIEGDPAIEILNQAKDNDYELIVIGSKGKNELSEFFMGSVSTKVYENTSKAVLIVKKCPN